MVIDNIIIVDLVQHNMSIDMDAPGTLVAGKSGKTIITVTNKGEQPAKNYTVRLLKGEEEIYSETVAEELGFYKSKTFTVDFATDVFTEPGDVSITAEVVYQNDTELTDNKATAIVSITAPKGATPADVAAQQAENSQQVTVSWSAPEGSSAVVTEDFDNTDTFAEFSIAGITAQQNTGTMGDWTFYDGNSLDVYGFSGPMAWMVFNPGSGQLSQDLSTNYTPHSGTQFLASFCTAESVSGTGVDQTDHWLISPQLPGVAQTISFFARALTDSYGAETFEVLYSTTDKAVASFQSLGTTDVEAVEWTEYSFNLPEGAKYFAIRHISTDVFALFIDDITYTGESSAPESYNVYVDQTLVTSTTDTSVTVDLTAGEHTVSITAVYGNGNESAPVSTTINVAEADAIQQILAAGKKVDVYTVDGRMIRQQTSSLNDLKPGVYVIDNQKIVIK